jgi:hypothetical protein
MERAVDNRNPYRSPAGECLRIHLDEQVARYARGNEKGSNGHG